MCSTTASARHRLGRTDRRHCVRSPWPPASLNVMTDSGVDVLSSRLRRPRPQQPLLPRHPGPGRLPGVRLASRSGLGALARTAAARGFRAARHPVMIGIRVRVSAPGAPGWTRPAPLSSGSPRSGPGLDQDADRCLDGIPDRPERGSRRSPFCAGPAADLTATAAEPGDTADGLSAP